MNVLVIGAGGREHTLCWKINQSQNCDSLYAAPGNAGTATCAVNLPIEATDFERIKEAVLKHDIQLVVVGPEDPLVKGIHDFFLNDKELSKVGVIGPEKEAASLEKSLLGVIKKAGVKVNTANKDAFIKASKGIYDQFASEVPTGGALVKKVSSLAN